MRNAQNNSKTEVYYFQNGLHIQLPQTQDLSTRTNLNQGKETKKKQVAENLLKEYSLKKNHDQNYKQKPNKIYKERDNIVFRTERFLNDRQVAFYIIYL